MKKTNLKQDQISHEISSNGVIPNKTTLRTIQKTDERKELHTHKSAVELFESWNNNKQKTKNTISLVHYL